MSAFDKPNHAERTSLQEQLGVSFNSSSLRMNARAPSGETALQRVAALGMAVLHVQHGADRTGPGGRGGPIAEVLADPRHAPKAMDQIAGELASLLYHIRYGGQHGFVHQAIVLFAGYIGLRARFGRHGQFAAMDDRERQQLLLRFAERALHEWLSDRCVACGGSGKLERSPSGSWIRPRGLMQRNATFRVCDACHGSRRAVPSHTARRVALGVTIHQYEAQRWAQHFNAAFTWLSRDVGRLTRPLTAQLERSKKRV